MKLKDNKGIGLSDAIIAIAIFIIFSGMIISISYNIYLQSNFIKRNDTATNYIVDVFEYAQTLAVDEESTDEILKENLKAYINSKPQTEKIKAFSELSDIELSEKLNQNKGYIMQISVNDISNYNDETIDYESNIIKQIDVSVSYKLSGKIKTVNMSTLLTK